MRWCDPVLVEIDEEDMHDLLLAITIEELWAEVGGMDKFVRDTAAKYGGVARVVEVQDGVVRAGKV